MDVSLRFSGKTLLAGLFLSLQSCSEAPPTAGKTADNEQAAAAIRTVLTTQAAAWNRGDIPGFMQGYWKSDSLVFLGRKGPTYGWQQTLDNYKKNYPDAAAMGQLDFSSLRVTVLNTNAAQVIGRWHLARPVAGDVQGYFLLVMRQIDGNWVVAADHTNSQ
ncbi:nuclear transport factor 2 family protein [Hymenobacter sp. BT683]|uniref:Nuclear transport factor 2 family protein n=1 Tax=Hymenobacter jeongseonensis TaxID=2791027 RepID=A0ABS0IKG0_9BACT|nr:nuclear transport factor 2 family protein [Hymenobacter jeongseonensis]MBF9238859.1 nuclear transport factor 2 family protein [Hymenobacter jeongseonensis]